MFTYYVSKGYMQGFAIDDVVVVEEADGFAGK